MAEEQKVEIKAEDVVRAINTQGKLLEEIVKAADHIVRAYVELTKKPEEKKAEVVDVAPIVEEKK